MERLNFETLFRVVRWDYNRCFKDESLDKNLFMEKYGKVMGEHYYNKFVHEFNGNIMKMIGYRMRRWIFHLYLMMMTRFLMGLIYHPII